MEVIHDWADDKAAEILAAVRRVAPGGARLLIVEALVSESPGPHFGQMLDIIMLAVTGGRERTRSAVRGAVGVDWVPAQCVISTPSEVLDR